MRYGLLIVALLLLAVPARAAFTVDERSLLHFGVSAGIGFTLNAMMIAGQGPQEAYAQRTPRRAFAFAACMLPGLAKEFVMDSKADAGDLFFNGLGCGAAIALGDALWVAPTGSGVAVGGRW